MSPRTFAASFAQRRLWFLDQLEPGTAAYNLPRAFRVIGPLDLEILRRALDTIVRRHASLRTVFDSVRGEPRQVVLSESSPDLPLIDLTKIPGIDPDTEALRIVSEEGRKPFDLREGPLLRCLVIRLGPERHVVLLVMHHIITDGWSISILFREVTSCYAEFARGKEPDLPELPIQYAEYAQWQHECMNGEALNRQTEHWKSKLAGAQSLIDLPLDHPRPTIAGWHGATEEISLDGVFLAKLKTLAQAEGATSFMVAMAAFQALLWRYTNQESILVGTPVAARSEVEFENMVGLFVNTLVFRSDFSNSLTFRELIRQVRAFALDAYTHQDVPFEKLVEALVPQRSLDTHPLFQVMFTFQNIPKQVFEIPGLSIKEIAFEAGIAKFDLSVEVWEDREFHCQFEYRTDLFEQSTMRRMLGHFETLLHAAFDNPDLRLAELPMMNGQERAQVLVEWNRTAADYPRDQTIHGAFEQQVSRTPDATALLSEGSPSTYRRINDDANRLAHLLVKKGIGASCLVGILLDRSVEMVVALLAVLKTGAAYVPLDRGYPAERIRLMLTDAGLSGVITVSALQDRLPAGTPNVIELDNPLELKWESSTALPGSVSSEQTAYVIYTSGSTGGPKGVEGSHRASMNRFAWMWRTYPFASGEVCCQKTNLTFVDSIWEIFGPLLAGIPSVIVPQEAVLDPELLLRVLARERVTRIVLVPSQLRACLDHAPNLQQRVPDLKLWSCSGEVLPGDLARRFRAAFPGAKMLNIYGASEVAADATCHEVAERDSASVPIGKPISNTQVYVVDECSNAVPIGIRGEIYIGGEGLARGYRNQPELTAGRFVRNWMALPQSERLYRTGDLGRWRGDGEIEYLGRVDTQIKLRGVRIELSEIESVLATHPAVPEAVVVISGEAEQQKLAAYLVVKDRATVPEPGELRRYLRAKLPEHMVPASYWQIEKLPLLPSGKVNRAALAGCGATALVDSHDWVGPRTETETQLAAIWQELLKVERVGVDQSFFELGGHSLLVLQMTARIRRAMEVDLPVRSVFETPTIAGLAQEVEKARALGLKARSPVLRRRQRTPADPNREELLEKLGTLSPAELQSVLQRVLGGKKSAGDGAEGTADAAD
jgi:amino acid adenylation domain-containing protein